MANELETTNKDTEKGNESVKTESTDTATLEARIKALEAENGKLRQANTNASAEASKYKKQYQDTLSEADRVKAEQEENNAAMKARLAQLESEANIAKYTAALTANDIGMEITIAKGVAEALNANEIDKVFDGIRKFIVAHDKGIRETALMNNQTLPGGETEKTVTLDEFRNMSLSEMMDFKISHPDIYAKYTS